MIKIMRKNNLITKTYTAFAVTTLALTLISAKSYAVTLSQDEARQLEQNFDDFIEKQRLNYKIQGISLVTKGDVNVNQKGNKYYAVTLPHLSIEDKNFNITEIGVISMNIVPSPDRQSWKASFAIPTPINVFENGNELVSQISIGGQKASAIWNTELNNVIKADIHYDNVKFRGLNPKATLSIPKIKYTTNLDKNKDGTWSGPANLNIYNLSGSGENHFGIDIEAIEINADIENLSPDAVKAFEETNAALGESRELNNNINTISPSHFKAYTNMLIDYYSNAANGFDLNMKAQNVRMNGQTKDSQNANLMVKNFEFGIDMQDIKSNKMSFDTNIQARGMKAQPTPGDLPVLFPKNFGFNVTVHNFPYQNVLATAKEDLRNNPDKGEKGYISGSLLNEKLPQMAKDAGTYITLQNTLVSNDNFKFLFDGTITPDLHAKQSMVGNIKATVYEHDKLMQTFMMNMASNPFLMLPLSFQSLAVESVDNKGVPVHIYDFKVDKSGGLTINDMTLGSGGLFGR